MAVAQYIRKVVQWGLVAAQRIFVWAVVHYITVLLLLVVVAAQA